MAVRSDELNPATGASKHWRVDIERKGHSGLVHYREWAGELAFHWEFGGPGALALVFVGNEAAWRARPAWAADRRAEIVGRVAGAVLEQMAPAGRVEIDDRLGWINILGGSPASPQAPASSRTPVSQQAPTPRPTRKHGHLATRLTHLKFVLGLIVLGVAVIGVLARSAFMIAPDTGFPLVPSLRTPQHVATLIQTQEPYLPSLHRDPSKDRYRLALFLYPIDGRSAGRMIGIVRQRPAGEFRLAKLLGSDGHIVWYSVNGIGGVDLETGNLVGPEALRAANPGVAETWDDPRRVSFDQRLRVTSPDRRTVLEIEPETLKAVPARVERSGSDPPFGPVLQDYLSTGVRPSPNEWLGLHTTREVERDYRPNASLTRSGRPEETKAMRRFYRGVLGPELDRGTRTIVSMDALGGDEYLNAAFVRAGLGAEPIRLSDPESFLMIHTSAPGLGGTLVVSRVDRAGKPIWKTDTGIDRFHLAQILPDARYPAFIGTRPQVPDKVSEPILVVVDTQTGTQTGSTLWK